MCIIKTFFAEWIRTDICIINPFMPNGFFYLHSLGWSISNIRGDWLALLLSCFVEISGFNVNRLDPDQTPHSAASDGALHCLPMPLLWDARYK